jgi:hypothetical protein
MNNKTNKTTKYISPNDRSGKQILKYMHHVCSEALLYCQKQGIESFSDFAKLVELKSQDYQDNLGDKALITAKTNQNGIVLQLKNYPDFGVTTGKKMQEHLGNDTELSKFTKLGIEKSLGKVPSQSDSDFSFSDLPQGVLRNRDLASFELVTEGKTANKKQPTKDEQSKGDEFIFSSSNNKPNRSLDDLDDLVFSSEDIEKDDLDFEFEDDTFNVDRSPSKNSDKLDSFILDDDDTLPWEEETATYTPRSTKPGEKITDRGEYIKNLTDGVDGTTFIGMGMELAGLTQILSATYLNAKDSEAVEKTIARLLQAQKRYKKLEQRSNAIASGSEEDSVESNDKTQQNLDFEAKKQSDFDPEDATENVKEQLTRATNKLIDSVNNSSGDEDKLKRVTLERTADLMQQLKQINKALDRLEQKLADLEARIDALEEKFNLLDKQSRADEEAIAFAKDLLELDKLTPDSEKQIDDADELETRIIRLDKHNLTVRIHQDADSDELGLIVHNNRNEPLFLARKNSKGIEVELDKIENKNLVRDIIIELEKSKNLTDKSQTSADKLQVDFANVLLDTHQTKGEKSRKFNLGKNYELRQFEKEKGKISILLEKRNEQDPDLLSPVFRAIKTKDEWEVTIDKLTNEQKMNIVKYFENKKERVRTEQPQNKLSKQKPKSFESEQ